MGYGGGRYVFNGVARSLIDSGADDSVKGHVLGELIDELQQEDWDTEEESLEEFYSDPVIAQEFYDRNIWCYKDVPEGAMYDAGDHVRMEGNPHEWVVCGFKRGMYRLERDVDANRKTLAKPEWLAPWSVEE